MPGDFHKHLVKTFGYRSAKYKAHDSFKTYNYTVPINHSWFEQTFEYFISVIGYFWWAKHRRVAIKNYDLGIQTVAFCTEN